MKKLMNMKTTLLLAGLLGFAALPATAQDNNDGPPAGGPGGPGGPGGHRHPPPLPLVTVLDANHDGVIDANEIANASAALLTLDKDGDGVLTTNEYLPPLPKDAPANAPRPPLPPIVKALDANGDGVIDADEIANASAALKSLDKNGDGKLTRDEYLGRHLLRAGHPGGPQGARQGPAGDDNMPPAPPPGDRDDNNAPPGPPPGDADDNNPPPGPPPGED